MKLSVAARQLSVVAAMAVLLAGCGGGGDSGSAVLANAGSGASPAAVTAPPAVTAPGAVGVAAPASVTDPAAVAAPVTATDPSVVASPPGVASPGVMDPAVVVPPGDPVAVVTPVAPVAPVAPVSDPAVVITSPAGVTDTTVVTSPAPGAIDPGGPGQAGTLTGQTVSIMEFHGTAPDQTQVVGPRDVVVGDGVEVINEFFAGFVTIDLSGTSLRMTAAANQPFGYFEVLRVFDTNGTIRPITSVSVDPATNYAGFDASRLNFTADSIDINLTALSGHSGEQIVLNIGFGPP